jgi:hypothetical protein
LQTQAEIRELCGRLLNERERLETALAAAAAFCGQNGIPFDCSRSRLALLAAFARTIAEAPEELLHLQSVGLTREGSHQAIEALARLQREWTALASDLDALFYLDALPPEGTLKQAVLTFREGEAWYRSFQTRWRAAASTHKSLQRTKRRIAARHRLAELERVIELLQLKERWKRDPAWLQYVGWAAPAEPIPLDGHVALAAWNRSVKLLLEDLGAPVVAPAELTPEKARVLRRAFGAFGAHLAAATSALSTIDALLPGLAESPGGTLAGTCAETVLALVRAIEAQIPWLEENAFESEIIVRIGRHDVAADRALAADPDIGDILPGLRQFREASPDECARLDLMMGDKAAQTEPALRVADRAELG